MTTTTGDSSSGLKTPSTLSGGDLVSRLLAATPPYLYNVPMTPHSFFFSEMLRSFVQAKADTTTTTTTTTNLTTGSPVGPSRRRKRSWRDARDRPLELTTKDKSQSHNLNLTNDKYFHHEPIENRFKNDNNIDNIERKTNYSADVLKPVDENRTDFTKQSRNFFDDSSRLFGAEQVNQSDTLFSIEQKIKTDSDTTDINRKNSDEHAKMNQDTYYNIEEKTKMDFSTKNFLSASDTGFNMTPTIPNPSEFMPNPLWYPPYPLPQTYPGIDPLHFFIDLRVSGHIWDRKLSERQLTFKSKNCSAFSVPQTKEYNNRPLDLTRDEATTSKNDENYRGTHFIMKHLSKTYNDIRDSGRKSPGETEASSNEIEGQ